jgi:hypothetical protein
VYDTALFVLQHVGLGRLVVLGRSRTERGVLRVSRQAVLAERLGIAAVAGGGIAGLVPATVVEPVGAVTGALRGPWRWASAVAGGTSRVLLKGPRRGLPLSAEGLDGVLGGAGLRPASAAAFGA